MLQLVKNTINGWQSRRKYFFKLIFDCYFDFSELTEDMKILKDGVVKNLQIGVHKYYFSKVWTCTKHIGKVACGASLKIRGTRYLLKRPHRCNTSKKEKDTKTELESQAR